MPVNLRLHLFSKSHWRQLHPHIPIPSSLHSNVILTWLCRRLQEEKELLNLRSSEGVGGWGGHLNWLTANRDDLFVSITRLPSFRSRDSCDCRMWLIRWFPAWMNGLWVLDYDLIQKHSIKCKGMRLKTGSGWALITVKYKREMRVAIIQKSFIFFIDHISTPCAVFCAIWFEIMLHSVSRKLCDYLGILFRKKCLSYDKYISHLKKRKHSFVTYPSCKFQFYFQKHLWIVYPLGIEGRL